MSSSTPIGFSRRINPLQLKLSSKFRIKLSGLKLVLRNESIQPQLLLRVEDLQEKWEPPQNGFFKLNCDGAIRDNGRASRCGGILRGGRGEFILAYSQRLNANSVLETEIQAIIQGVKLAWNRGIAKLIVESDSVEAIELLRGGRTANEILQKLIEEVFEVGDDSFELEFCVVGRRLNDVADRLAKESDMLSGSSVIYYSVPDFLVNLLAVNGPAGPILIE